MEKTNPVLKKTIRNLEEKGRKEDIGIWKRAAEELSKPRGKPVNIAKIQRHAEDGETVLVPGKVTGYGELDKKVTVAAFSFSKDARDKIEKSGKAMSIEELVEKNPEGSKVKIMK